MKYFLCLLTVFICSSFVYAQSVFSTYATNPTFWINAVNATPIANVTPIVLLTPAPTPTGTPAVQRYYITDFTVANSHATVDTDVQLLSGTTVLWTCPAAHGGGGCTKDFQTPLRGAPNTAINCKSVTTGAAITCSISGWRAPS